MLANIHLTSLLHLQSKECVVIGEKMRYFFIIIGVFLLCRTVYASGPTPIYNDTLKKSDELVSLAKETLKLNADENDYFTRKEALEKFADIKDNIQTALKNGNKEARVDIFLLLDGLVQNNLSSLQSFLATSNYDNYSKEFSQSISYEYAEKIAYALKENKHLLTTEYIISNPSHKGKCTNYVNGFPIKNNISFMAPAGLTYYVASYCDDNTFSLNKIQAENAQAKYEIHFASYQEISRPMDILTDTQKSKMTGAERLEKSADNYDKNNNYLISSGVGYNYFSGKTKDESIYTSGLNYGSIIYSTSYLKYKNFLIGIDLSATKKDAKKQENVTTTNGQNIKRTDTTQKTKVEEGIFIRPSVGINAQVYSFNQFNSFFVEPIASLMMIKTQSYSSSAFGFNFNPGLKTKLEEKLFLISKLNLGADFSDGKAEFVVGAEAALGLAF